MVPQNCACNYRINYFSFEKLEKKKNFSLGTRIKTQLNLTLGVMKKLQGVHI